ncbi:hypothetical protein GQ53DRAFT_734305 [Thozetella sp. PMI_491]|nr:hypothetical protein GQ53DRAFT_734305 [Thozetella sp. PMI_491]
MGINHQQFIAMEWVIVALCLTVVGARLAVRTWQRMWAFWMSEIFLILSLLLFMSLVVGDTYTYDENRDVFSDDFWNDPAWVKWKFASAIIYDLGFYFPRFSLLAFYQELFPISETKLRTAHQWVTLFNVCAFLATGMVDIMWCGYDVSVNWSSPTPSCSMLSVSEPMYITWPISIVSEILVFLLPFPLLRRLKTLERREKNGLKILFLLGISTLIISIVRFSLLVQSMFSLDTCEYL